MAFVDLRLNWRNNEDILFACEVFSLDEMGLLDNSLRSPRVTAGVGLVFEDDQGNVVLSAVRRVDKEALAGCFYPGLSPRVVQPAVLSDHEPAVAVPNLGRLVTPSVVLQVPGHGLAPGMKYRSLRNYLYTLCSLF